MKLRINGIQEEIAGITTLQELIVSKGLTLEHIVIEHNANIISRDKWPQMQLQAEDSLEIVSFVGGG